MINNRFRFLVILLSIPVIAFILTLPVVHVSGTAKMSPVPVPTPVTDPLYSAYRAIAIGMTTDETRAKLGSPKEKADDQDFFQFSDHETSQVYYDAAHKVIAITVTYSGKLDAAPTAKAVFGEDVAAKPDGGIFKMVRYPKAGFWISYNKTGGNDPLIMIAIQKM